jgi:hypothetical protein
MTPNGPVSEEQIRLTIKRLIAQVIEREPEEIPHTAPAGKNGEWSRCWRWK